MHLKALLFSKNNSGSSNLGHHICVYGLILIVFVDVEVIFRCTSCFYELQASLGVIVKTLTYETNIAVC